VPASELARAGDVALYPGMPTEVMIKTGEHTFLEYLLQPIRDSFARAFTEQ
jgi:multidrug efflux pump subunit AcrA (membrane-fusion protein)